MKGAIDELVERDHILDEAGYRYSLRNEIYVNRETRKVFSREFVEDHTEEEIRKCMERPSAKSWQFYFNDDPPAGVRRELIRLLDNGHAND